MSTQEHKAIIRRWIEEAWNRGNVDIASEIYAPHYIAKGSVANPDEELHGPEAIKQLVLRSRVAFPDIHFTIDDLIAEEDKVVGVFTIRGTHTGSLDDIAQTGKRVIITAVDVWRFAEGKIVERCLASIDRLDLLRQLGVSPF